MNYCNAHAVSSLLVLHTLPVRNAKDKILGSYKQVSPSPASVCLTDYRICFMTFASYYEKESAVLVSAG